MTTSSNPITTLQDALRELTASNVTTNEVLNRIVNDYAKGHAIVAVLGGFFLTACLAFCGFSFMRYRRAPKPAVGRPSIERKAYFWFGALGSAVVVFLAITVDANTSTAFRPQQGFGGTIPMIGIAEPGSSREQLHQSFASWLQSDREPMPATIQRAIDDRLSWQGPKAVICAVLLVVLVALGRRMWSSAIRSSRLSVDGRGRSFGAVGLSVAATVGGSVLLMLMVLGNTAASLAPLAMTLAFD